MIAVTAKAEAEQGKRQVQAVLETPQCIHHLPFHPSPGKSVVAQHDWAMIESAAREQTQDICKRSGRTARSSVHAADMLFHLQDEWSETPTQ